jgi:hypothetical protein
MSDIIYKEKTHIIDRVYKVTGYMKTINKQLNVECGVGNNQIIPKESDCTSYIKLQNLGDLNIKVRFGRNGKEMEKSIKIGGKDSDYDSISIYFTGQEEIKYSMESIDYFREMMSNNFMIPRLDNPDYTSIYGTKDK